MKTSKAKVKNGPYQPRSKKKKLSGMDLPFLILTLLLLCVGLITLFSASYVDAIYKTKTHNGAFYFLRQAGFALSGLVIMLAASRFNYHKLHYFALPSMVISIILLIMVLIPGVGITRNSATRWLQIGTDFQPSEIAKFAVILCFASLITLWGPKKMRTFRYGILPFMGIIVAIAALLVLEPHLSATVIVGVTGIIMIFLGGANLAWLISMGICGAASCVGLLFVLPHAMTRVKVWLDPFSDFKDKGWQGAQSLMAVGSGGVWGLGLGQGRQKHLFLPEPFNDFIFAVICEELGLIGAILIIIMFAALILRGYQIALRAPDRFGTLLVAGITTQIALQTIFNMGVVTGLLPVTGAALPFFSYGGTSLWMLLGEVGIILSVSRRIPAPEQG